MKTQRPSVFTAPELAATFPAKKLGATLFAFDEISSTNSYAMRLIRRQPYRNTLILADCQTDGRGRLDRSWFSPPGVNIYASLLQECPVTPLALLDPRLTIGWIPLLTSAAICHTIEEMTGLPISVKWPNDLLVNNKKLGGILCEMGSGLNGTHWVVIGFGININITTFQLPSGLRETTTSLRTETGQEWDRLSLLQQLVRAVEAIFSDTAPEALEARKTSYHKRCTTIGQIVKVSLPNGSHVVGKATSIGQEGQLQIIPDPSLPQHRSDKILDIHAGDIIHLLPTSRP